MQSRKVLSGLATLAMVAGLIVAAAFLMRLQAGDGAGTAQQAAAPSTAEPSTQGPSLDESEVALDQGAVSDAGRAACLGGAGGDVLFASRQATDTGPVDVLVV